MLIKHVIAQIGRDNLSIIDSELLDYICLVDLFS
jgi:hypothetical protein